MKSKWNDQDAAHCVAGYARQGIGEALALRVYTSRLIGGDPALVLHGGGNTSVKDVAPDLAGRAVPALYVKGSGWDLASIEPPGFPAVRLAPLLALRDVPALSDEAMVNALRVNLLDAAAPSPSVEALLHAFLPQRYVDHTHADAILALVDQPDPQARCADVFGDRLAVLPFVFPGFPLAGIAARAYEAQPDVEGIVLVHHGLFTFGETARESYERMIAWVSRAEAALAAGSGKGRRKPFAAASPPAANLPKGHLARLAPLLRGALGSEDPLAAGGVRRMILHHRSSAGIRAFVDGKELGDYARRGVSTPDHIIRTKNVPLILPPYDDAHADSYAVACRQAVADYVAEYKAYFEAGAGRSAGAKAMLDPLPRIVLVPGAGLFAAGRNEREAVIAADIYEHTIDIVRLAEGLGRYTPLEPQALFEMEYWSLEQAKLGKGGEAPLARQVTLVTGAASGIGAETALIFAAQGAHVVLLDRDARGLEAVAARVAATGVGTLSVTTDVTQPKQVAAAFAAAAVRFGGVDIVISNAGKVWQGAMADCSDADLRASFELNFFAHQHVAAEAVRLFRRQQTGGQILFNASKSAFNPGPGLGPYTLPKAATIALMRQYALDYGHLGIRSNAVNADRVATALFGAGVLEARAQARGLSVEAYLSGNLLGKAVGVRDVARAFLSLALAERTTGAVLPVDGGNIAAAPR
ncbi:MAG: bifunctional aldolase/short-chain dehydrogenase [Candidatus Lambdaproteobacteria bacterium]|nr:bifunctional aldolase/short-chain dehydrogenase [Candidatus Lambdaproteobacteria bacterium]